MKSDSSQSTSLPASSSNFILNLVSGCVFLLAVEWYSRQKLDPFFICALGVIYASMVLILGDIYLLKSPWRDRVGLIPPNAPNCHRIKIKLLAFYATYAVCVLAGSMIPTDSTNKLLSAYQPFQIALILSIIPVLAGGSYYIAYADSRLSNPEDGLWHLGNLLCGNWAVCSRKEILKYLRSVLLRSFFLPSMFAGLFMYVNILIKGPAPMIRDFAGTALHSGAASFLSALVTVYFFFSAIDVLFATIGYIFVFRLLDTDVRSTEPTLLGWLVCVVCYPPLFDILFTAHLLHPLFNNGEWYDWLNFDTVCLGLWGGIAIIAMCLESMTTLNFGIRFSNLTYRGIVTGGLFRFTKHPQYIAKMLNRFFVYLPFVSTHGVFGTLENMAGFALLCFIYFLRARTEENHLAQYPEYTDYARYIEKNGIFRWAGKLLPFLRYSPDRANSHTIFSTH